jgi:hypothetical protein
VTAPLNITAKFIPAAFNKLSPAYGSTVTSIPTLKWGGTAGATSYQVCWSKYSTSCTNWTSTGTSTQFTPGGLTKGYIYYWQIRAVNSAGATYANGSQSSVWKFIYPATSAIISASANDGWILESSEKSKVGGMTKSSGTLLVGDNSFNQQYRAILSFKTGSLPDGAVIDKVSLKIRRGAIVGTNPFTTHKPLMADIKAGYFGSSAMLQVADFQATASINNAGSFKLVPGTSNIYNMDLNKLYYGFINKTSLTQFRLRFVLDDNNDMGADYANIYGGEAAISSYRPVLIIQYHLP